MIKRKKNIIGRRMRARRIALGISVIDLANKMGEMGVRISAQQVMAIERGERKVVDYEAQKIALTLKVKTGWLITGTNR